MFEYFFCIFFLRIMLVLTYLLLGPSLMTYFLPRGPKSQNNVFLLPGTYVPDRQ